MINSAVTAAVAAVVASNSNGIALSNFSLPGYIVLPISALITYFFIRAIIKILIN